jgi:hypothetical protein
VLSSRKGHYAFVSIFAGRRKAHFFFSPAVQFRTTVSASGDVFAMLIKKRFPSEVTSQRKS